ncbi:formate/nitrite transporter family protein [Sporomusa sp.]|uniref:formate/nitrite transporter family protein n=1 Tax=Sporomusa sp. TaxID=2078658 RepID=UPI002CB18504|nr:formate/nitrite transporter family protein [Sporomusa sp.]HWR41692.1 formate/nitrite transporter family protein [Sporomusa sp.]
MYSEDIAKLCDAAEKKAEFLKLSKSKYLLSSALAGVYVGFAVLLVYTIGGLLSQVSSPFVRVAMGLSFGIALSLVTFAGSELFTGNNMTMTVGSLEKKTTVMDLLKVNVISFIGNLLGSAVLAGLFISAGLATGSTAMFIGKIAQTKMSLPWTELLARGILCNTLVCLAIWCSIRAKDETAKLIIIFWCLFAFITTGFEHSVANMTLLSVALLMPGEAVGSLGGFVYNIAVVTLGNVIGGALVVGTSYWYISKKD